MIHHLSPPTGLEPGTFKRVSLYSSLPQEAIAQAASIRMLHNPQKSKHIFQGSLRPLMAEFFMVDVRILYILVVKISDFFEFF
jgi:hypothetical protein